MKLPENDTKGQIIFDLVLNACTACDDFGKDMCRDCFVYHCDERHQAIHEGDFGSPRRYFENVGMFARQVSGR